ncbi:hypothetical protein QM334_40510, partial [Burkholderia cenocepacia]|nr:hypothetical protein [Burkholderia cenocepacia]
FVSRRTMALEASLGVRLLHRNTRNLAVTESGQEFYVRAQRILAEIADAEQAMSVRSTELHGSLKISAPLSFGITHVSPLIAEFLFAHHFAVVRDERPLHVERPHRAVDAEFPADPPLAPVQHARVASEIGRRLRRAVPLQVRGARA